MTEIRMYRITRNTGALVALGFDRELANWMAGKVVPSRFLDDAGRRRVTIEENGATLCTTLPESQLTLIGMEVNA